MKRIAALVPNTLGVSPGQRTRIETWAGYLKDYGWEIDFFPFEDERLHDVIYRPGDHLAKAARMIACYINHAKTILRDLECNGLFLYREAALIGPAVLERFAKRHKVPLIFDIDDPIFLPYRSPVNKWMSLLKFSRKTHSLFRMSDRVIAINTIIGEYARRYNKNVSVVPNFVDTDTFCPRPHAQNGQVKIVWTGSISTLRNLASIGGALKRLQGEHNVQIRVVANGETDIPGVKLDHRSWTPEIEVSSLQDCDIGIVPLMDLDWNPWKFYLKTIQYMSVGLPVVARRIGSNAEVIEDGVSGFLVDNEEEWVARVSELVENEDLRRNMGDTARQVALTRFSVKAQIPRVAEIFDSVYGRDV